MLGPTYRFQVLNSTGQTIAVAGISVRVRRFKYGTDGSATFESSQATAISTGGTTANGAYATSSTIDNTTDKYLGGSAEFTVVAPTSASGNVTLYLQRSVDGGTTWGDDGLGVQVATLNFTASGTKRIVRPF